MGQLESARRCRAKKTAAGICISCRDPALPGIQKCDRHAARKGTPRYKFTPEDVERIRIAKHAGRSGRELAAEFGISLWHLYRITRGEVRRDCPGPLTRRGEP
jgi:hypothetical protein